MTCARLISGEDKAQLWRHYSVDPQYTVVLSDSWLCGFNSSVLKRVEVEGPERDSRKTGLSSCARRNAPSLLAFLEL